MKTSQPGAYHTTCKGFGEHVLIDTDMLDLEQKRALKGAGCIHEATMVVNIQSGAITFRSPLASVKMSVVKPFYSSTRSFIVPVLDLHDEAWCLGAIHAGILPKGRTLEEALAVFDAHYATSRHESLAIRDRILAAE